MMIRRKHHRTSKLAQRRRKIFLFKIGGAAVGVIALFVGLVYVAGLEEFNISEITVEGNSAIAERSIKEIIEDKISGKLLFLFPKSNILLYPREDTEAAVLEAYKSIKEIKISVEDLQSISVTVDERKPFALWCDKASPRLVGLGPKESEESCYFLDEDGYIFTKAPSFSGSVYFRYFSVLSDLPAMPAHAGQAGEPVGQQFMESPEFQNMTFFLSSLSDIGLTPVALDEVDDEDYEMHLEEGGKILFGQKQDLSFVFDNIQSVFKSDEFNKDNLLNLDYADFRFGNKVYFKFE